MAGLLLDLNYWFENLLNCNISAILVAVIKLINIHPSKKIKLLLIILPSLHCNHFDLTMTDGFFYKETVNIYLKRNIQLGYLMKIKFKNKISKNN